MIYVEDLNFKFFLFFFANGQFSHSGTPEYGDKLQSILAVSIIITEPLKISERFQQTFTFLQD